MLVKARNNPFRTTRLQCLAFRSDAGGADQIAARLAAQAGRGAIVGPHGSGKTTLMRELGTRLGERGMHVHHRFASRAVAPTPLPLLLEQARRLGPDDALLFDGADQLAHAAWRRLLRAAERTGTLIVTAHRAGLLPTLVETRTDVDLLEDLSAELLGGDVGHLRPLLGTLCERHGGNLREALLALYDRSAEGEIAIDALEALEATGQPIPD